MNDRKQIHTSRMPIRWGDLDALGHVNNTTYFRYMEQARIEWFAAIGYDVGQTPDAAGQGPVLINTHCTFLRSLKYPGEVEVRTFTAQLGRTSFETVQEIYLVEEPEAAFATGGGKVVWIDYSKGQSVPLPAHIRSVLLPEEALAD